MEESSLGFHSFRGRGILMSKTALITGGTRGIGLGIARCLSKEGYDLVVCGRREKDHVEPILAELQQSGRSVWYVRADLGSREDRTALVEEVQNIIPHLNVLVNNAGVAPKERNHILDATEESFEDVIRINLQGTYFLTQQCARWMIGSKQQDPAYSGSIININSISSTVASVSRGEYCISKAGLSMATKLWSIALAEHDISVFEIRPGLIATDMTSKVKEHYDQLIEEGLLLQPRWGVPEDIGKTVAALARGDIPYATGQVIVQDGGLTSERL